MNSGRSQASTSPSTPTHGMRQVVELAQSWLLNRAAIPNATRTILLQTLFTRTTSLVTGALVVWIVAIAAFARTGKWWAIGWLVFDVMTVVARIFLVIAHRHAHGEQTSAELEARALLIMSFGLLWTAALGIGCFLCLSTGDPVLALLSSVVVTGVIGALAFRNGGVPRYAMLQMALCEIPLCVGMLFQADRWVWLLALKSPFYAMGMMNIVRDHARMLTTTIFIEQKTRDLAARLDAALVNMPVGVLMFEAENGLQVWNERAAEILQIDFNAIERGVGLNFLLKMAAIMPAPEALLDFEELVNRLEHDRGEAQALLPTGRAILLMGRNDHNGILSIMIKDITQRRQAEARVTYLAHHDALTGLSNRNDFNERLTAYYDLENGLSFTLLYIDLDGFKNINDTLGHQAGDQLLRAVAGRLSNTAPPNSTIARLGGDEFAVIAPLTCADAVTLAEQLIINIARPYKLDFDYPVVVGASIGVAQAHESLSAEMLQSCADRALYAAKAAGRGVVRVFNDKLLKAKTGRFIEKRSRWVSLYRWNGRLFSPAS